MQNTDVERQRSALTWAWRSSNVALVSPGEVSWWWECDRLPETDSVSCLSQVPSRRRAATYDFERSVGPANHETRPFLSHIHQGSTHGGPPE